MGGFVRVSAPITFVGKNLINGIVEEHTMPAGFVAKYLFEAAIDGNINKDFTNIEKSYQQGSLDALDDKKLKGSNNGISFNYTQKMPENWKFTDNVWDRYFNITSHAIGSEIKLDYIPHEGRKLQPNGQYSYQGYHKHRRQAELSYNRRLERVRRRRLGMRKKYGTDNDEVIHGVGTLENF
mgnify:CR=1 FL=1